MWSWLVIGALYVLALVEFWWLGGVGSAGEAFRSWGRASSTRRAAHGSSSSH